MYKIIKWVPNFGLLAIPKVFEERVSIEEAMFDLAKEHRVVNHPKFLKQLVIDYESLLNSRRKGELLRNVKGESREIPKYPIKDRKKYNLFKKIYKLVKRDLEKDGKISEGTLESVKELLESK